MALPRQECWSELLFPSPGGLPDSGTERSSPALAGRFFTTQPAGNLDVTSQCCELSSFPFTFTCFLLCYSCSWTIFCSSRGAPRGQNPQLTYDLHLPRHPCTVPWVLVSDSTPEWMTGWVNESRWNQQRQFLILPSAPTHLYGIFLMLHVLTGNPQNIKEIVHDGQKLCSFEVKWLAKHSKVTNHDPQPSNTPSMWVERGGLRMSLTSRWGSNASGAGIILPSCSGAPCSRLTEDSGGDSASPVSVLLEGTNY